MTKRTAMHSEHLRLGAKMVDFAGWEMPVQYVGLTAEHQACRTGAALFDVSHMGELIVQGDGALDFVNHLVTNDVSKIPDGKAMYTAMCHDHGGIVDDLVVYRWSATNLLLVVNASNTDKDYAHAQRVLALGRWQGVTLKNVSDQFTQIALQGPKSVELLKRLTNVDLSQIKTYAFADGMVLGSIPTLVARTGYTGEDGFELYCPWDRGPEIWRALVEAGATPAGLGARDTLRLEMKYPLYGNELTDDTLPLEVGLGWVTKLDKNDFVGRSRLVAAKSAGIRRTLVGLKLTAGSGAGIARQGYEVLDASGAEVLGVVTSGTVAPSLGFPIAIALVRKGPQAAFSVGTELKVRVRQNLVPAQVVQTPFYQHKE